MLKKLVSISLISLGLTIAPSMALALDKGTASTASQSAGALGNQTLKFKLSAELNKRERSRNPIFSTTHLI